MKLDRARVLFAAQYAAPYKGNFLPSLAMLEQRIKDRYGAVCAYLFPRKAEQQPWWDAFRLSHKVYLSGDDTKLISKDEADAIIRDFSPSLVHTHFEGYDKPMAAAIKRCPDFVRMVWHMHDTLSYQRNMVKAFYQRACFFRHYGVPFLSIGGG